mmetsp:Transcript_16406/g.29086  ORF Transcript_16406/g.29086 Transcript_16406/m.29086 type:complete len:91 (+) Transcript_16406:756-1028(+)
MEHKIQVWTMPRSRLELGTKCPVMATSPCTAHNPCPRSGQVKCLLPPMPQLQTPSPEALPLVPASITSLGTGKGLVQPWDIVEVKDLRMQ